MTSNVFIDTNILVYAHDQDKRKKEIAQTIIFDGINDKNTFISTQILSEFFVTITKKLGMPASEAIKELKLLNALTIMEINYRHIINATSFLTTYSISYWDSLVLSSAQLSHCGILYSEDLSHLQSYGDVQVINPFKDIDHPRSN